MFGVGKEKNICTANKDFSQKISKEIYSFAISAKKTLSYKLSYAYVIIYHTIRLYTSYKDGKKNLQTLWKKKS